MVLELGSPLSALPVRRSELFYDERVKVNVLFFGVLKDFFQAERDLVELPEGATVADLLDALLLEDASEPAVWKSLAVSVNREYRTAGFVLHDGDEVGLLPPVSGGLPGGAHVD